MIEADRESVGEAPSAAHPDTADPAALGATACEVWRAMLALTMGGSAPTRMHAACQATDLTPGALKILMVIADGSRPMRELVEIFRHDPSYLTGVVDLLERQGVARRVPHPTDRRAKVVAITAKGEQVLETAQELMAVPPAFLAVLSPAELAQLLALLARLVDAEPNVPAALRPRIPSEGRQTG
jgi:DNA-binding MarR family transcriptional regulator